MLATPRAAPGRQRFLRQTVVVDGHQRRMWVAMLDATTEFRKERGDLGALVSDLRGLFVEADPHEGQLRSDFESVWAPLDGEHELRTEPWAPGRASDEALAGHLDDFEAFVRRVLAADQSPEHS
jgi:hypothetical protein